MSVQAMAAVFAHSRSKGSARLMILAMADEANTDGLLTAYKRSQSHLARKANVDEGTARRAIAALVDLGEVDVLRRGDGRQSSDYRLVLPGLIEGGQDAPPAPAERTPTEGEVRAQGGQDAPPIIPVSPTSNPSPPDLFAGSAALEESIPFEKFWDAYPRRNGKKVGRADAERLWAKLSGPDRQTAMTAVANYRTACDRRITIAKDAHRWLRAKADWGEWATPATPEGARGRASLSSVEDRVEANRAAIG